MDLPPSLPAPHDRVKGPAAEYPVHAIHCALLTLSQTHPQSSEAKRTLSDALLGLARWVATAPGWPERCPTCGEQVIASPETMRRTASDARAPDRRPRGRRPMLRVVPRHA